MHLDIPTTPSFTMIRFSNVVARTGRVGALLCASCFFAGCGGEEPAPAQETPASEPADEPLEVIDNASTPRAAYGGTVVAVGALYVEILVQGDGAIGVAPRGDDFPTPSQIQLTLTLTGDDGAQHPVVLTWDPASERFRGLMRAALPIPGAVEVKLVEGDETYRGRSPTVIVSAQPTAAVVQPTPRGQSAALNLARAVRGGARPSTEPAEAEATEAEPAEAAEAEPAEAAEAESTEAPQVRPVLEAARTVDMSNRRGRASPGAARRVDRRTIQPGQATVRVRE